MKFYSFINGWERIVKVKLISSEIEEKLGFINLNY